MHKILMIEDDTATRDALERHLSRWGYQVRAAKNFQNILEQLEAFHPHLVLLDISLPFFDGYYWCRQIRRASQVPILFLSSAGDDMNLVMAINLGADDFIPKPFRIEVVLAKIQAVLRRTYSFGMQQSLVQYGDVSLNPCEGKVWREDIMRFGPTRPKRRWQPSGCFCRRSIRTGMRWSSLCSRRSSMWIWRCSISG